MYEKLIEALREESRYKDKATLEIMDLCMEAASALESLEAELAALRGKGDAQAALMAALKARIERAREEAK